MPNKHIQNSCNLYVKVNTQSIKREELSKSLLCDPKNALFRTPPPQLHLGQSSDKATLFAIPDSGPNKDKE